MAAVIVGGGASKCTDVVRVARDRALVVLAASARDRISAGRAALDAALAAGVAVYGANRGLGARSAEHAPTGPAHEAQIVRGRATAVGPPLSAEVVRALLFARIVGLGRGGAGASPTLVDGLVSLLNDGPEPVVPSIGSVGVSDLTLLAHAILPLLDRIELAPKDALAAISANAVSVGWAALVVHDAGRLLAAADEAAVLALAGYAGSVAPLDERAALARPAAGQIEAAARLRALLAGGELPAPRRLQDPLSFRCLAAVHGAACASVAAATTATETELAATADNPLVLADGTVLHTGNFHAGALALSLDTVRAALHGVAAASAARVAHLLDERSSGLPRALTTQPGTPAGLVPLQKTTAALLADIRRLAAPALSEQVALSEGVEDLATGSLTSARDAAILLERFALVPAVELIVAAQAIDLRGNAGALPPGLRATYERVRSIVPRLDTDRPTGTDVDRLAATLL